MQHPSYAVFWDGPGGERYAGRLELLPGGAVLTGGAGRERTEEAISFEDVTGVRLGNGRLDIRRRAGRALSLGNLDGPGALRELADRLTTGVAPA